MKTRSSFIATLAVFLSIWSAHAADPTPLTLSFQARSVTASGISPGDSVAFFGVAHIPIPHAYMHRVAQWANVVTDTSHQGSVTLDLQQDVPPVSVWAAVDLRTKDYVIVNGPRLGIREMPLNAPLRRGPNQLVDRFVSPSPYLDLLYVEPSGQVWFWSAMDGTSSDVDGQNSATAVSLTNAKAVSGNATPPAEFRPGGVLIAVDFTAMRIGAVRVTDALVQGAK